MTQRLLNNSGLTAVLVVLTWLFGEGHASADPIPIADVQRTEAVDFEKDILPILQKSCLACHSASEKQGELVLETPDAMRKGGDSGPAVIPGRGANSLLLKLASHQDVPEMPPANNDVNAKPLTSEELGLLRLWIDQGARGQGGVAMLSPKAWRSLPTSVGPVYAVALTEDGQHVAVARGNQLFLYHVATGRLVTRLTDPALSAAGTAETTPGVAHRDLIQSLAFNRDGDLLASGGFRKVKLWRKPSDVQLVKLEPGGPATAVAVSPDKQWIATTGANHTLKLFNAANGQAGATMTGHTDVVTSLRFTPDGARLVSSSLDQTVWFWNIADGSPGGLIETPAAVNAVELVPRVAATAEQPNPPHIVVTAGADNHVRTWTLPTSAPAKQEWSPANLALLAVSHDRRYVAASTAEGVVRVLQSDPAKQPAEFEPAAEWKLETPPVSLAFVTMPASEGGQPSAPQLVTSTSDGAITLWKWPNPEVIVQWRGEATPLTTTAASIDGRLLATGVESGAIVLWNLAPEPDQSFEGTVGAPVTLTAISPSGTLLAAAGIENGKPAVFVRNLENGQITHKLLGHEAAIRAIAFSGDNGRLVTGSDDKTVRVWNLANAAQPELAKLEGHAAAVTAVAFSPDGNQALSGAADNALKLWNLADGTALKDFAGHTGAIVAVGFAPGNLPFSVSADRSVRFWNAADGNQARAFNDQAKTLAVAMRADGQQIALAGEDKQIRIHQIDNGQLLQTLAGHTGVITSLNFSSDGKRLVSTEAAAGQQPGRTFVWDLEANPPRLLESFGDAALTTAVFDKQPDRLLVGRQDGSLVRRQLRFLRRLDGITQPISALVFHSNAQTLFACARDGSFRGYATANGQQTFATGHGAAIHALALSPNEQVLATAGENAQVRLWQTNGGGFGPQQLAGFPGPVKSVAFSADGTKVVAGSAGEKPAVLVFDLQTGVLQQRHSAQTQPVTALVALGAADDTESTVLSASADGIWRWSLNGIRHIPGHGGAVTSLATLPGTPMQVFSGSADTTVRRWNLENGQQLGQYNHGGAVVSVAVRPDGQRLASASDNHTAKLWNINGQQIAELRGDVRRKTRVARLTQQQNAANQRLAIAKQRLDAAEKDVPVKTEAEKQAAATLAAANKDVTDKQAALKKALDEKIAAEKVAIEASTAAREALVAKSNAEEAAKAAAEQVPVVQQRAAQLAAASNAKPADEALKKAAAEAQQAVATAQQTAQQMQQAVAAPTQAAQTAVTAANQAAQKVTEVQKPYNDALAALKTSESAQNLASQQQAIAARELKTSQEFVPVAKDIVAKAESSFGELQKLLESANQESAAADLAIRSVAFSPDSKLLATAGDFPSVHTWDAETGTALSAFAGHTAALSAAAFLDDSRIVSASADGTARAWDLNPAWKLERTIGAVDQPDLLSHRVMSLDFSDDATRLLVGGGVPSRNGELHIFNVADGSRTLFLPYAHDDVVHAARFSPDGSRIASAGADKYLRTFDIGSAQQLRRFEGHTNYVLGVAWKGDGQTIVTASADKTIKVWNAETADQDRTIPNFPKHVTAVRYIGETDNIVSTSGDRLVRMHNAANGGNFRNFGGAAAWLHAVDITPDANVVAAGSADGALYLWNGNNGQALRTINVGE